MNRRNFFGLGLASLATLFFSKITFGRVARQQWDKTRQVRVLTTDESLIPEAVRETENGIIVNDSFCVDLCNDLNRKLANHFASSGNVPITDIKIHYINILDRKFFQIIAERLPR